MGVWIETYVWREAYRERCVTPYVGVWIETRRIFKPYQSFGVTPYVGVWIETTYSVCILIPKESLLMWECGLKLFAPLICRMREDVTPYVGVWIETYHSEP